MPAKKSQISEKNSAKKSQEKKSEKTREANVFHFGLRWSVAHDPTNQAVLLGWLRSNADLYMVQAENTGDNPHYQGYFHLKNKRRPKALAIATNDTMRGVEIRAASTNGQEALRKYCMKEDTRVAGPWSDKPVYLGKDLWPESRFLPWQKELLVEFRKEPDDRTMHWVYDPVGNKGKTKFAKFLCYKMDAVLLGYAQSGDVLNLVSKMPGKKVYVWNLTRAKPAQLSELDLYSAMESVKDGAFINTKYETRMVLMNPPHICVFANHLPKTNQISSDRWRILQIDDNDRLVDIEDILASQNAQPYVHHANHVAPQRPITPPPSPIHIPAPPRTPIMPDHYSATDDLFDFERVQEQEAFDRQYAEDMQAQQEGEEELWSSQMENFDTPDVRHMKRKRNKRKRRCRFIDDEADASDGPRSKRNVPDSEDDTQEDLNEYDESDSFWD